MALAVLRRFDLVVLGSKSSIDDAQAPAPGARVDFYRQGATVAADATVEGGSAVVDVFDLGQIVANDEIQAGIGGPLLTVLAVNEEARTITVSSPDSTTTLIPALTRLMPTNNPRWSTTTRSEPEMERALPLQMPLLPLWRRGCAGCSSAWHSPCGPDRQPLVSLLGRPGPNGGGHHPRRASQRGRDHRWHLGGCEQGAGHHRLYL